MQIKSYYWAIFAAIGAIVVVLVILPLVYRGGDQDSPHSAVDMAAIHDSEPVDFTPQIEAYQELIAANPNDALALAGLGEFYMGTGNYQQAVDQLNKALAIEPQNPSYHRLLGEVYYSMRMPDVAIHEFEKGLASDPNNQQILLDLGNVYAQTGQPDKARELWQRAYDINSRNRWGHVAQQLIAQQENPESSANAPDL